jgi:hypothetical protein
MYIYVCIHVCILKIYICMVGEVCSTIDCTPVCLCLYMKCIYVYIRMFTKIAALRCFRHSIIYFFTQNMHILTYIHMFFHNTYIGVLMFLYLHIHLFTAPHISGIVFSRLLPAWRQYTFICLYMYIYIYVSVYVCIYART